MKLYYIKEHFSDFVTLSTLEYTYIYENTLKNTYSLGVVINIAYCSPWECRQDDPKLDAILSYVERPCLKNKQINSIK
jgi:hypothetical protein